MQEKTLAYLLRFPDVSLSSPPVVNKMSTIIEIDQSTFDALPRTQRLMLAKKSRQEQLRKYHAREREARRLGTNAPKQRSPNKKGTRVNFQLANQLRDAITRYDIKEGMCKEEIGGLIQWTD